MPTVAEYTTVQDSPFEIGTFPPGDAVVKSFTVHSNMATQSDAKPIVFYKVRRLPNTLGRFRVHINGTEIVEILSPGTPEDIAVGRWEIFAANLLNPGLNANNEVRFSIIGNGNYRVSDVVIWYQRDI